MLAGAVLAAASRPMESMAAPAGEPLEDDSSARAPSQVAVPE
jgi:hypothetical protein